MPSRQCPICRQVMPASDYQAHRRQRHGQRNGSTSAWRRLRARILDRDGHRCTSCGATDRLEVHHVKPVADGGRDEPANLVTLCVRCHPRLGVP